MYLHEKLEEYENNGRYPMHMPGHKRQLGEKPYDGDITEIEGFDNLHHSEGILKSDREKAAEFYGAGEARFLVNGSTCGVLAAISAVTEYGDSVLLGRNSHKSAYHAIQLRGLKAEYVYPDASLYEEWSIDGPIPPEAVRKLLEEEKVQKPEQTGEKEKVREPERTEEKEKAREPEQSEQTDELPAAEKKYQRKKAVFITSPTYEGVLSDIRKIAEICHGYGIPLIVDEAHGAHLKVLGMGEDAVEAGADIVISGLHKTMPVLTQGALLLVSREAIRDGRVSMKVLDEYLGIYESSSPSYVLMGSISRCVHWLDGSYEIAGRNREKSAREYRKVLGETRRRLLKMKRFRLFPEGEPSNGSEKYTNQFRQFPEREPSGGSKLEIGKKRENFIRKRQNMPPYDAGKLVISTKGTGITGNELADRLREMYQIETEMASADYIIAMTSVFDTEEGLKHFADAMLACDEDMRKIPAAESGKTDATMKIRPESERLFFKVKAASDGYDPVPEKNVAAEKFPEAQIAMPIADALSIARRYPQRVKKMDLLLWQKKEENRTLPKDAERKDENFSFRKGSEKKKRWEYGEAAVSVEYIYVYPPGIPIIAPGEIITKGVAKKIICDYNSGCALIGCGEEEGKITVNYITAE